MKTASIPVQAGRSTQRGWASRMRSYLWGYFFILPNLLLTVIFFIYPLFEAVRLSFYRAGLAATEFIGFDNYVRLFQEQMFLRSIKNTFLFVLIIAPVVVVASFTLAAFMQNLHPRMKTTYRMLFYLPAVCTPVVLTMVWSWIYNMNTGLLNYIVGLFGSGPVQWLGSPSLAVLSICAVVITWSIGEPIILYLASMDAVPKEYYEAAEIDGASPLRRFFHITLPAIANTSLFVILTTTIAVFQIFVVIQLLTGGGPFYSTETLVFTIYRTAFVSVEFGLASAQSVVLFVIIMIISLVQLKFFKPKT